MKYTMPRNAYVPEDAEKVVYDEVKAEIYRYDTAKGPAAAMFGGKRSKPDKLYYYRSLEAREKAISDYLDGLKASAEFKASLKAKRNSFKHTLKVGDLLRCSWGYDQTNVDFYQVTDLIGKTMVEIRPVAGNYEETGFMSGTTTASKGHFIGDPMKKRVGEGNAVRIASYASAYPYDGKPTYESHYA